MKKSIVFAAIFTAMPIIGLAAPGAAPAPAAPPPNANTPPPNVNTPPPNVNTPPPMPQPQPPGSAVPNAQQGLPPGNGQVVQPGANVQPYLNQNVQRQFQRGTMNQPAANQYPMPPGSLSNIPTNSPDGNSYYNNSYYNNGQPWATNGVYPRMRRHHWNGDTNYINPNLPPRT